MKLKNIFPVVLCILIGFFMGNYMFHEYNSNDKTASLIGENLYFLNYGVYDDLTMMKDNMKDFHYYIYTKENDKYYTYIGITKNKENLDKLKEFYKRSGYDIYEREIFISNISFLTVLEQYDNLLKETTDDKIINSIEDQVLSKYEELILNEN